MASTPLMPLRLQRKTRATDNPRPEIIGGAIVGGLFLAIGVIWASFLPLDAAVFASGTVKVSGERQKVQVLREGIVSRVDVTEGQAVRSGQPLVEFATVDARASERSYATQAIGLQAQIARLQAQMAGETHFSEPDAFRAYRGEDRVIADAAMQMERSALASALATRSAERAVLDQRVHQIGDQISGNSSRRGASDRQRDLLARQLDGIRTLTEKGYASKMRLLDMERQAADLDGTIGEIGAENARLRSAAGETRLQMLQGDKQRADAAAGELRDAQTRLQTLLPQWAAARDALERMVVRAPVAGTVVGLAVHNGGAVAANGQTLMEIVPKDGSLTVEARVAANEVNQLFPGQKARLRIAALHGRNVPELIGTVTRVSADSFVEERTGASYYTMGVTLPASELTRLRQAVGRAGTLRPGNPVQVLVTLRARTALEYWLEPLTGTLRAALHEN